jgi:hypothetical protein
MNTWAKKKKKKVKITNNLKKKKKTELTSILPFIYFHLYTLKYMQNAGLGERLAL